MSLFVVALFSLSVVTAFSGSMDRLYFCSRIYTFSNHIWLHSVQRESTKISPDFASHLSLTLATYFCVLLAAAVGNYADARSRKTCTYKCMHTRYLVHKTTQIIMEPTVRWLMVGNNKSVDTAFQA